MVVLMPRRGGSTATALQRVAVAVAKVPDDSLGGSLDGPLGVSLLCRSMVVYHLVVFHDNEEEGRGRASRGCRSQGRVSEVQGGI